MLVAVDPVYYRPSEVELLWGNPAKAKRVLGWAPTTTFAALAKEMTLADLALVAKGDLSS